MKNLTFALACASTFALFAAIDVPKADFEGYTGEPDWTVANKFEPGSQDTYWFYDSTLSSADGSTVKAYGGENLAKPTKGDLAGNKYLELSTEGGTLWRSLAAGNTAAEGIANKLGAAQALPAGGLYIDTMVQFTATEDGGAPETTGDDKLAIWLNVNSSGVTNLMVKATKLDIEVEKVLSSESVYTLANPDVKVDAGVWYRLTVKAVKNVLNANAPSEYIPAFQVFIDGNLMAVEGDSVASDAFIAFYSEDASAQLPDCLGDNRGLLQAGTLIPSLTGYRGVDSSALQAVGFKGSGALDNLSISETEPQPAPGPEEPIQVTPQITLSATEATFSASLQLPTVTVAGNYVLDTDYTVSWSGAIPTENPSKDVVLTVTVKMCGKYSGSNTATFTVKPASTPPVVNDWPSDPTTVKGKTAGEAYGFTGDLADVPADKLAAWAKGNGSVAFSDSGKIDIEAYLLNVANTVAAIAEGKANFKIPSITVDANGTVTVTDPVGSYNGVITIKGSVTVNGTYNLDKADKTARFFKAFLSVK